MSAAQTPTRRALLAVLLFAIPPATVLGVILGFSVGWVVGIVAFVVAGAGLAAWPRVTGDRRVLAHLAGRDADPKRDARLTNLVEGLSTGAGVRQPRLVVIDSPELNALAAGISGHRAILAVTSGLLKELDRIELEAVLAEELYLIRHRETVPGTVLAATFGWGRSVAIRADADTQADLGSVALTRYPPALAAALEKMDSKGSTVSGQPGYMAHLWLADPRPSPPATRGRLPLRDRIEALREL